MSKEEKKDTKNAFWVDDETHRAVKIVAAKKGMTMQAYVKAAIEKALKENGIK